MKFNPDLPCDVLWACCAILAINNGGFVSIIKILILMVEFPLGLVVNPCLMLYMVNVKCVVNDLEINPDEAQNCLVDADRRARGPIENKEE